MKKNCTEIVRHSKIKVEEKNRKAVFCNPSTIEYKITTIDGCQIKAGERTDFLVSKSGSVSVLVELKGKDVEKACSQLFTSVDHPNVKPILEKKLGFLIICSRYPRFDSFVVKAKQKAAVQYKAGFHVVCDKGEFDIERVAAINGPY